MPIFPFFRFLSPYHPLGSVCFPFAITKDISAVPVVNKEGVIIGCATSHMIRHFITVSLSNTALDYNRNTFVQLMAIEFQILYIYIYIDAREDVFACASIDKGGQSSQEFHL